MAETRHLGTLSSGYPRVLQPPSDTAIHTSADGLTTGPVWIPVGDGLLPAYRAMPGGAASPPVLLVVQEVFGVDDYLQDVCCRAARAGFLAVAPELFARHGKPGEARNRQQVFAIALAADDAQVMADLDACVEWASTATGGDRNRLGITGFCWGGRIVWLYAAHASQLKAGVAWYGRLTGERDPKHPRHPVDVAGSLHAPVLGLYGSADEGIPLDTVDQMKAALAAARAPAEIVVYDGAPHAFHADYRPSYRADAAADGWTKMLAWFERYSAA